MAEVRSWQLDGQWFGLTVADVPQGGRALLPSGVYFQTFPLMMRALANDMARVDGWRVDVGEGRRVVTEAYSDIIVRHDNITAKHGQIIDMTATVLAAGEDVMERHADIEAMHVQVTDMTAVLVAAEGDIEGRHADIITKHADITAAAAQVAVDQPVVVAAAEAAQQDRRQAEQAAQQAQGYAAGLNLPAIAAGDAGKALVVNPAGTGYVTGTAGLLAATGAEAATGTSTTKAVTPAALAGWLPALTELPAASIDTGADRIPIYDASGAVVLWVRPSSLGGFRFAGVLSKTSAYTVTTADAGVLILASGTWTLALPAAASAGNGFACVVKNTSSGTITVDPAGSETVNGSATIAVPHGASAILICDGAGWQAIGIPATDGGWTWDPTQIGTGLALSAANTVVSTANYGSVLGNTSIAGLKYFELTALDAGTGQRIAGVCVAGATLTNTAFIGNARGYGYNSNGTKANNGSGTAFGATYTTGDVLGFAVNTYTLGVWPRKNGVWQGGGDPVTGANPMFTLSPGVYYPASYMDGTSGAQSWKINAGLIFAPPSGFTPL